MRTVIELPFLKQMDGPVLGAGGKPVRPSQRRYFDAHPYFVVGGQDLSRQRRIGFRNPVTDVAPLGPNCHNHSDENTTQNDEIATQDSSLRKSRRF